MYIIKGYVRLYYISYWLLKPQREFLT